MGPCQVYTLVDGTEDQYRHCGQPTVVHVYDCTHPFVGHDVCDWHFGFEQGNKQGFVIKFTAEVVP
jgi:hypothetical protein